MGKPDKKFIRLMLEREVKNMYELATNVDEIHGTGSLLRIECIKNALEHKFFKPKELVEKIGADPELVYTALLKEAGFHSKEKWSPELKKFEANSKLIFEHEQYFESGYKNEDLLGIEYKFQPPSVSYLHLFYQIYKWLCNKEYNSPEQLKELLSSSLKGKQVLELGCGPGFALRTLKDLDAEVTGIEINKQYADKAQDLNIKYGDAKDLLTTLENEFDLIFSRDFFSENILKLPEACSIASSSYFTTKENGFGIHQMTYQRIPKRLYKFGLWAMSKKKNKNQTWLEAKKFYDRLSKEEQEKALWTNHLGLEKNHLEVIGFKVLDYSAKNGDFNIIVKKV